MREDYIIPIRPVQFKHRRKKSTFRVITLMFLITLGSAILSQYLRDDSANLISPMSASFNHQVQASEGNISSSLEAVVNKSLEGTQGKYALVIKNLKTGETYSKDADSSFESASIYKLWVMGEVYQQVKDGDMKLDDQLSESVAGLNSTFGISSEYAELTSGYINYSVDEALTQMITISHNYAALALSKKARLSNIKTFLAENGLKHSSIGTNGEDPLTTPADAALYFDKLYHKELVDGESSDKMIETLKQQKKNNKLPKYLPGVVFAHKTGEIGQFSHDAGIVYSPKGDYIIVVFSESTSPAGAEDRIALLSKDVYGYFQNQ